MPSRPQALVFSRRGQGHSAADRRASHVWRSLKRQGFRVVVTDHAHATAGERPDLIVLDSLGRPQMVVELKRLETVYPGIPVLVMTARVSDSAAVMGYRAGAVAIVTPKTMPLAAKTLAEHLSLQASSQHVSRRAGLETYIEPAFHDARGRLDAMAIARAFGVSVSQLARSLSITPSALSKRSTADAAQAGLRELEFVWVTLTRMLGNEDLTRAWLNAAHPDLGGQPPLVYLRAGRGTDLAAWVRGSLLGEHS
jgi:DNA-binding NarL/FixJ family response regulator